MCCLINLPSIQSKYLCYRHARPERKEREEKERQKECLGKGVQFTWNRSSHTISGWSVSMKMGEKVLAADNNDRHQKRYSRAVLKGKIPTFYICVFIIPTHVPQLENSFFWIGAGGSEGMDYSASCRIYFSLSAYNLISWNLPYHTEVEWRLPGSMRSLQSAGVWHQTKVYILYPECVRLRQLKHF